MKPTKQFLVNQINACREAILQNQGAINLCENMLKNGCYLEEALVENNETTEKKD